MCIAMNVRYKKGNWEQYDFLCKAWCHYDRCTGEWERDEPTNEEDTYAPLV